MNSDSSSERGLKLRDRFRGATRDAILDAAASVFIAGGATNARMEDIAANAGIAVGTVYNYFEDRTALVTALLETRTRALFEALDAAVQTGTAPGADRTGRAFQAELERFVAALARHFDANRSLLSVLLEEELHRGIDVKAAVRRRTVLQEVLVRAERLTAKGIRTHALRKGDPAVFAALLVGMVRGIAMSALARREASFADGAQEIVRMFLKGVSR
ncbi:MAG: TetR/AcrR family transcriptional regulator [Vicinamibacterales bacterium]